MIKQGFSYILAQLKEKSFMNRLTRILTFLNSSESKRFHSLIGDSHLGITTVKSLAVPFSFINLRPKSFLITSELRCFSCHSQTYGRKVLPEELSRNVITLTCESSAEGGTCDVYVVGTVHVSEESCQEVKAVINFLKPQVVFLELCADRVAVLTHHNIKVPTMGEMMNMWKKNENPFGILYSWYLAKVANQLEVVPGAEFRAAYKEAVKYGGKVLLGDRPVKLKEMENYDMLTLVIQDLSKNFPTLWTTLVHERDLFMSSLLLRVAGKHNSVVAVVGKGYLPGIKKNWKQPIEVKELLTIPSQKPAISVARMLSTLGVTVAGVAILSGIYTSIK